MKWLFYLVSLGSVPMAIFSFSTSASDIQLIIGFQFVSLCLATFGIGKILARQTTIISTLATQDRDGDD